MRAHFPLAGLAIGLSFLSPGCSGGSDTSAASGASASRWYVYVGAPEGGDGSSWERASPDLAAVLEEARAGDEVWVSWGVHRPAPRGGPRAASFALTPGVRVYGGFAGNETSLAERDPAVHVSILDGDLAGDDGPDFANRADNVWHVVVATEAHGARLDGFTIRGGYADGPSLGPTPESGDQGSGINVYHGGIEVVDCTLRENWASNHGTVNDHSEGSIFDRCRFVDNASAQFGAGLYLHHEAATLAIACTFRGNVAASDGGGAYARSMHGARFEDCLFEGNSADRGAGLYAAPESAPHVARCDFVDNAAFTGGGGIYNDESFALIEACGFLRNLAGTEILAGAGGGGGSGGGGVWTNGGAVVAMDCSFHENRASFGGGFYAIHDAHALVAGGTFVANVANEAGGLYTLNSPIVLQDSTFVANEAKGGSFSVGGGVSNYYSDALVERCTFERNRAELGGGGLYNEGEEPIVRASRFLGNAATGDEGFGGGIFGGYFAISTIEDCVFVGNTARQGGGTFDIAFSEARIVNCTYAANTALEGDGIFVGFLSTPTYANCIVADGVAGTPAEFQFGLTEEPRAGRGNVTGAPSFARAPDAGADGLWGTLDDDYGDVALVRGSPGIDAGANEAHTSEEQVDLANAPRFVDDPAVIDSGAGTGAIVDMGALERQP